MATYASTTNPFIESKNLTENGHDRPAKKDAPGMARPQYMINDMNKKKEIYNVAMSHERPSPLGNLDANNNNVVEATNNDKNLQGDDHNEQQNGSIVEEDKFEDEIAKACDSLVESAAKLYLDDKRSEIESLKNNEEEKNSYEVSADKVDGENDENAPIFQKHLTAAKKSTHHKKDVENNHEIVGLNVEEDDDGEDDDCRAPMDRDKKKNQHIELIKKLRLQLRDLERYAYERGELEQVPPSVLAERQTVIIETLKEKLSLSIDKDAIERLDLEELKRQVDKEIHELIDPLVMKEHLLCQLKTQLTDLERYISHLHKEIGRKERTQDKTGAVAPTDSSSQSSCLSTVSLNKDGSEGSEQTANFLPGSSLLSNETLPKTSRLIRSLIAQLICSDIKIRESIKKEHELADRLSANNIGSSGINSTRRTDPPIVKAPQFHDGAAWTLHIDKVTLAADSLINLFTLEPQYQRATDRQTIDERLVESVVRRQLVPAIKDLLSYGLIDPSSFSHPTSYASYLFDPYYLLTSLTCFPSSQAAANDREFATSDNKTHIWNIIEDYYQSRNEPNFKQSSVKTLSQSFSLTSTMNGPMKITSKQSLLITVDDIVERMSSCKPNGPETHLKVFVYTALNQCKLATWLRLIFKNKSVIKKYYHNFSFVSQPEKMDKFLATLEPLSQINDFKLTTDPELGDQFVGAF